VGVKTLFEAATGFYPPVAYFCLPRLEVGARTVSPNFLIQSCACTATIERYQHGSVVHAQGRKREG
jgi:hypothetical protein